MVDVKNLSELLSQSPDVVDIDGARPIPILSYRLFLSVQVTYFSYFFDENVPSL